MIPWTIGVLSKLCERSKTLAPHSVWKLTAVLLPKALAPHSNYEELIIFKRSQALASSHSDSLLQSYTTLCMFPLHPSHSDQTSTSTLAA